MISDVDVRDWEHIDVIKAKRALNNLDNYSRMGLSSLPEGPHKILKSFIEEVESVQRRGKKQIAALFQSPVVIKDLK